MSIRLTALTDPEHNPTGTPPAWPASQAGGVPVGSAFLRLFTGQGRTHLAELLVNVHPAERRNGTGSLLLGAAVSAARDDGRRSVIAQAVAGTPGDLFLAARGFRKVLTLTYARPPLTQADVAVPGDRPGYRLASWDGAVPDELAETFTASLEYRLDL